MAVIFGRNTFVIPGMESTWGTESVSYFTKATKVISASLARVQQRDGRTNLSTSDGAVRRGFFDVFEETGGNLTVPLYYDSSGIYLQGLLGTSSSAAGGASGYIHTYDSDSTALSSQAFSLKLQRGSDANGMEAFLGCMVSGGTISVEAGSEMTLSMDLICKTSNARTTAITPTFTTTGTQIYHYEKSAGLTFNGVTYDLRSMEISIDNKLERRNVLGSKLTLSPDVTDYREITMTCEMDLEDNLLYTAMLAGTESSVEAVFTQTSGTDLIAFAFRNAIITDYSDPISSVGRLTRSVTFTALATASQGAFKIEIQNASSSSIAE